MASTDSEKIDDSTVKLTKQVDTVYDVNQLVILRDTLIDRRDAAYAKAVGEIEKINALIKECEKLGVTPKKDLKLPDGINIHTNVEEG